MLYWVMAMAAEARPVINQYHLYRRSLPCRFEIYENKEKNISLVVTGTGMDNATIASSFLLGLYPPKEETDLLINLGICGGTANYPIGSAYQCLRVCAKERKDIYPAWAQGLELKPALLSTEDHLVTQSGETDSLYDMEGYAVLKAAGCFLSPDQLLVIKVVSDHLCQIEHITREQIQSLVQKALLPLKDYLDGRDTDRHSEKMSGNIDDKNRNTILLDGIIHEIAAFTDASLSMKREIEHLVTYLYLQSGRDLSKTRDWWQQKITDTLCKNRKAGKELIALWRKQLQTEYITDHLLAISERSIEQKSRGPLLYVEEKLQTDSETQRLLSKLQRNSQQPVWIHSYLDLFQRSKQSFSRQKKQQAMIFAKKEGELIYQGAPMCHDYGYQNFSYTSCVMNCIFDCEYCYLQGMYSCGYLVVFTNLKEIMEAAVKKAAGSSMYLAVSFDTDLLALEGLLHYCEKWVDFAYDHPNIRVELRTKSSAAYFLENENKRMDLEEDPIKQQPPKNLVLAWSLSPQEEVISPLEHGTASIKERLISIQKAMDRGWTVRLCFDPVLFIPHWKAAYEKLVEETFETLSHRPWDVSLGVFRLGREYLAKMRKVRPDSCILQYPYEQTENSVQYPQAVITDMLSTIKRKLLNYMPEERIFLWESVRTSDADNKEET